MKIYSVEYINHYLKDLINNEFKYPIAIKGEMSDLNKSNAGHYYFTLSSGDASISCAFFVNKNLKKFIRWKAKFNNLKVMVRSSLKWEKNH